MPIIITAIMFFGGNYRTAKLNLDAVNDIARQVANNSEEIQEGTYENDIYCISLSSNSEDDAPQCVKYESEQGNAIRRHYASTGTLNGMKYYISPMVSNRTGKFKTHIGYSGSVYVAVDEHTLVKITYTLQRKADVPVGTFFALPFSNEIDFSDIITSENYLD